MLSLIASGWSNREAAAELAISEITVQVHRRRVMQKMAARTFADLVRFADRLQLPRQLRWRPTRAFVLPRDAVHA